MKTIFKTASLLVITLVSNFVYAQPPDGNKSKREKIDRLKIGYITSELDLTSAESEKFWPVYNEMDDKIREIRKANRKIEDEIKSNFDKLSEEDAKKKMAAIFENEQKEAALKSEYSNKISGIIGAKRTLKLLSLEQQFRRELLERLSDPEPRPRPPQPRHDRE